MIENMLSNMSDAHFIRYMGFWFLVMVALIVYYKIKHA